jgi:hypothetical protein
MTQEDTDLLSAQHRGVLSLSVYARQSMIHCALIPKNSTGRQHARPEPVHSSWKDTP